ncbi:hypothetical protein RRF57_010102 [Xylaria bambusicola]|uniref:Uncharacterized protein n=1 Tax=Xylaria bambusicola TaxID=326684 RepID=A0AAN7ZCJ3_9PEZI
MSSITCGRDPALGVKHEPLPSYFTADDATDVEALWARSWFEPVWVRQVSASESSIPPNLAALIPSFSCLRPKYEINS